MSIALLVLIFEALAGGVSPIWTQAVDSLEAAQAVEVNQVFFTKILLLLTTALGLSFVVERILEFIKGIIKKILQSEFSPFTDQDALARVDLIGVELKAMRATLGRRAEELGEMELALRQNAGNASEKSKIGKSIDSKTDEISGLIEKYKVRLEEIGKTEKLAPSQLSGIRSLENTMEAFIRVRSIEEESRDGISKWAADQVELKENYPEVNFLLDPVAPRQPIDTAHKFWLQIIGVFTGICLCYFSEFGIFREAQVFSINVDWVDFLMTGILIGGGSEPVHLLIKFLKDRRGALTSPSPVEEISPVIAQPAGLVAVPAVVTADRGNNTPVIDVPYDGGVEVEKLAHRLRKVKPGLIVYHHTALHSDSSFQDVVRAITEGRGWETGYHCVVRHDGGIHPFCRWDCVGNHAYGVNSRSLGVTMNGNFHTEPGDSASNDRGQYGLSAPTDQQLSGAAKVVALWCHLYDFRITDANFSEFIWPHFKVKPTVCPGSNFPHDIFKQLVLTKYNEMSSPEAQKELEVYRLKKYIYSPNAT